MTTRSKSPAPREHRRAARRYDRSNQHFARALETIPLAAQTFSKSHQQWVRGATPLFLESGAGCRVTDPDGNVLSLTRA